MEANKDDTARVSAVHIVGVGRSGTTMLYDLLATCPKYRWISRLESDFFNFPSLNWLAEKRHSSCVKNGGRRSRMFSPSEGYRWWDRLLPRFADIASPVLSSTDLSDDEFTVLQKAILKHSRNGKVFLTKNTRNSRRIRILAVLANNTKFVHVVRHPLSVIRSMVKVAWWPNMRLWTENGRTPYELAKDDYAANLLLAARLWALEGREVQEGLNSVSSEKIVVKYEDLTQSPFETILSLSTQLGDEYPETLAKIAESYIIDKGRPRIVEEVSSGEFEKIWEVLAPLAKECGYDRLV